MADLLIAGGGIAGSSLAILLGRQGFTVELYEQSQFPREKPCGEGLMPAGVAVLDHLALAEAVGGEAFIGVRFHFGEETMEGRFPRSDGMTQVGRGQRRFVLDQVLFSAAERTSGVRAHMGTRVTAPLVENGRVVGLIIDGVPQRARLVVAADGSNSRLRHHLGLGRTSRTKRFGVRMHFRLASSVESTEWVHVFLGCGYELYVTPLPQRELVVAALSHGHSLDCRLEEQLLRWCREHQWLVDRLRGAEKISEPRAAPLGTRARSGVGPGIVLLGDAAGSSDPITGSGMTQALLSSELLAAELQEGIPEGDDWLWRFERLRRSMFASSQRLARLLLTLADRPRLARLAFQLAQARPELFSHLLAVGGVARTFFGHATRSPHNQTQNDPRNHPNTPVGRVCRGTL